MTLNARSPAVGGRRVLSRLRQVTMTAANQVEAARPAPTSSIRMDHPTARSACSVAVHARREHRAVDSARRGRCPARSRAAARRSVPRRSRRCRPRRPAASVELGMPLAFSWRPGTAYLRTCAIAVKSAASENTTHPVADCSASAHTKMAPRTRNAPGRIGTTTPTSPTRIATPTSTSPERVHVLNLDPDGRPDERGGHRYPGGRLDEIGGVVSARRQRSSLRRRRS